MDGSSDNKDNENKGHIMARKVSLKSLNPLQKAVIALLGIILVGVCVIALIIVFSSTAIVIVPIVAMVIVVLIVITSYQIAAESKKLPKIALDLSAIIIFSFIIGLAVIFMYSSVVVGSVPINYFVETAKGPLNMSIVIDREHTVTIPLKNAPPFDNRSTAINADVYHNDDIVIHQVKLSSTGSLLSHPQNFTNFKNSTLNENVTLQSYEMQADAHHNFQVKNITVPYTIDVFYSDNTANNLQIWSVPFSWSLVMEDVNIFSYFWVVLIGVMASRLMSLALEKAEGAKGSESPNGQIIIQLEIRDYIWIAFSFIIAILIFSSFSTQIQLTTNIVANISLAFGFGFGFDKVLEVAKRFQNIASP
jgi:hypothetical protein